MKCSPESSSKGLGCVDYQSNTENEERHAKLNESVSISQALPLPARVLLMPLSFPSAEATIGLGRLPHNVHHVGFLDSANMPDRAGGPIIKGGLPSRAPLRGPLQRHEPARSRSDFRSILAESEVLMGTVRDMINGDCITEGDGTQSDLLPLMERLQLNLLYMGILLECTEGA